MGRPIRINNALYREVREHAHAEQRTIARQLEFWARMGKASLDNPDLPTEFVKDLLIARAEGRSLTTSFTPEGWSDWRLGSISQAIRRNDSDMSK
jgi:hypothetical protein